MQFLKQGLVAWLLPLAVFTHTVSADNQTSSEPMIPAEFGRMFVMRVVNNLANVFTAEPDGGHGTGFLVEIRKNAKGKDVGVVFTNRHVIESHDLDAQKIDLEFSTDTDVPESVPAELVYVSSLHDFAVLEFELSKVKRAKKFLSPALFPDDNDPRSDFAANYRKLQGRPVMALGNPFDGSNISTFGQITGINRNEIEGNFVQTQTPINPGNSGGPLIDLEDGVVVGMNTAKLVIAEADNVGYSIPINVLLDEYFEWRSNPEMARRKTILVHLGLTPTSQLKALGVDKLYEKEVPGYFDRFDGALQVNDAHPATGLKTGDHIVRISGMVPGRSIYEYGRVLQRSRSSLEFEVIRNGKLVDVVVPVVHEHVRELRKKVDFVYLSGLAFRSASRFPLWASDPEMKSEVIIGSLVPSPELAFHAYKFPPVGSLLVGVDIGGHHYPIRTLVDLKRALNRHREAKMVRLDVKQPILVPGETSWEIAMTRLGSIAYNPTTNSFVVPVAEVVTPFQFSMGRFKGQFSFQQEDAKSRNWRNFVNPLRLPSGGYCEDLLLKPKMTKSQRAKSEAKSATGKKR